MATPEALSGAAARQGHAAEVLFTRYRDQIYRFCYARLRSREEAEDATQNVFMRVHMALKRGVVPEYEAAWLYKIAHNVCLSALPPGLGLVSPFGGCPPLSVDATTPEMMHIWVVANPGGPYAQGLDTAWVRRYHASHSLPAPASWPGS